jgi:hypothetical protein
MDDFAVGPLGLYGLHPAHRYFCLSQHDYSSSGKTQRWLGVWGPRGTSRRFRRFNALPFPLLRRAVKKIRNLNLILLRRLFPTQEVAGYSIRAHECPFWV